MSNYSHRKLGNFAIDINKDFKIHMKKTFSLLNISIIFIIEVCVILSFAVFSSFSNSSGSMLAIISLCSTGIIFGSSFYSWRSSTIYSATKLTANYNIKFYLCILFIILLIVFVSFNILILQLSFLQSIGIIRYEGFVETLTGLSNDIPEGKYMFFREFYIPGLFVIMEDTILTFSICFLITRIIESKIVFYSLLSCLLILSFFFTGMMNNYFSNLSTKTTDLGEDARVMGYLLLPRQSIMPESFFIPNLLFPYYSPSQQSIIASQGSYITLDGNV